MEKLPQQEAFIFEDNLTSSLEFPKFYEFKNDPTKIVRIEEVKELIEKHNGYFSGEALLEMAQKSFGELKDNYGIEAPVKFKKEERGGEDVIYEVVEKITQTSPEEIKDHQEVVKKFEDLYSAITKYYLDKHREGGPYIWDIGNSNQYVYGTKHDSSEEKFYLVDTDIWFANPLKDMSLVAYWTTRHMLNVERGCGSQFVIAREALRQLLSEFEDQDENVVAAKKLLNGEPSNHNPVSGIPRFE